MKGVLTYNTLPKDRQKKASLLVESLTFYVHYV